MEGETYKFLSLCCASKGKSNETNRYFLSILCLYFGLKSDHAWGGNYFMASGNLKGGKIFGEYPDDLTDAGPRIVSDVGIVMPSTPWEALWNGVAQWFGVNRYDYCLKISI